MTLLLKPVVPARGLRWIADAFVLFARRPLAFTMLFAAFMFCALLATLVPLVGGVLQMMSLPLLSLGFMVASRSAQQGGPVSPAQFIEPLRGDAARRKSLLLMCLIYGLGAVLILWLSDAVSNNALNRLMALASKGSATQAQIDALLSEPGVATGGLLLGLLGSVLSAPFWHAPALVHWAGQGLGQALFSSWLAVWRSKGAFLLYMLGWFFLIVLFGVGSALLFSMLGMRQLAGLAAVPAGLLFSTVFYVSLLFVFNDSFGAGVPDPAQLTTKPTEG
jgi:hypothetical protein